MKSLLSAGVRGHVPRTNETNSPANSAQGMVRQNTTLQSDWTTSSNQDSCLTRPQCARQPESQNVCFQQVPTNSWHIIHQHQPSRGAMGKRCVLSTIHKAWDKVTETWALFTDSSSGLYSRERTPV